MRHNVALSGQIGLIVSNDQKARADPRGPAGRRHRRAGSAAAVFPDGDDEARRHPRTLREPEEIRLQARSRPSAAEGRRCRRGRLRRLRLAAARADFNATHRTAAEPIAIEGSEVSVEVVDNPDYNADIEVNIIGFAQLLGDVINGLIGVFAFFALAFLITLALLFCLHALAPPDAGGAGGGAAAGAVADRHAAADRLRHRPDVDPGAVPDLLDRRVARGADDQRLAARSGRRRERRSRPSRPRSASSSFPARWRCSPTRSASR